MAKSTRQQLPSSTQAALQVAAERAMRYTQQIADRRVSPAPSDVEKLSRFNEPFPEHPCDPENVVAMLDDVGSPATTASTGGRYFGYVIGGAPPASMGGGWVGHALDWESGGEGKRVE